MQIVYHLGAHVTDEDRLLRCLLVNQDRLLAAGIAVPGPGRYRNQIREAQNNSDTETPTPDMQRDLLAKITSGNVAERLVLSASNFICIPQRALQSDRFYGLADRRLPELARLLPSSGLEFHIGLRNPATFIPALAKSAKNASPEEMLNGTNPADLFWSELLRRMRNLCPEARIVTWANEDTPLIWSKILFNLAGLPEDSKPLADDDSFFLDLISDEGKAKYKAYMASHPALSASDRVKVIQAFLERFARTEAVEEELDFSGWSQPWQAETIDALTRAYEEDLERIAAMPDIEFLRP